MGSVLGTNQAGSVSKVLLQRFASSKVQAILHTINVGSSVDVQYMHTDDHACCSSLSLGSARVKQEIFPADITHCTFVLPHQSTEISPSQLLAALKRTLMRVSCILIV